jgi:cytochrome c oxidase subunit 2
MTPPPQAVAPPFDAHSPEARAIAELFTQTLLVCAVIFAVVMAGLVYCVVRFRARDGAKEPPQIHGHTRLEITWTLIPILIICWLLFLTVRAVAASDPPPNHEPDLVVIGHQWWWEVRYRSGAVTANEVHIPVGRDLLVRLQSADVIHDFWAPQLARKIDATPGVDRYFTMQADAPGTYQGTCAEYCGSQHAWMRFEVIAQTEADFAAWERHQLEAAPVPEDQAAARGEALFRERTCAQCHGVEGVNGDSDRPRAAPDLTHVASRDTLAAGVLANDPASLERWLNDPQAIKPGSHMPSLQLTRHQLTDLVAYLETLK